MLPERDQQRLNEIEQELRSDDPDFARRLREHRSRRTHPWLNPTRTLAIIAAVAALLCLSFGEGVGFTAAALLAAALFFARGLSIRAQ